MTFIEAIILGIIQGLTEFLPVSSSGHLELAKAILGLDMSGKEGLLFTVVVHFGTALATVYVYRNDIAYILKGIFKFQWNEEMQFAAKIIISMIPAAIIGLFFNDAIEALFDGEVLLVSFMLIITALLLFLADKAKRTDKPVSFLNALVIGISQAIAILPGISRSGATISTSVLLGIDREKAARFSFLMVVPLIFGKMAKDLKDGQIDYSSTQTPLLIAGFITSFIVGVMACRLMIKIVKSSKLLWFSLYCLLVGITGIIAYLVMK